MIIKYEFDNGDVSEVEVSEDVGQMILDSRRTEESYDRKTRRHCYSIDAMEYEGREYGYEDRGIAAFLGDDEERNKRIREAFSHLTETQRRRLLMLSSGLAERQIALIEGVDIRAVVDSINYGRKKFLKFFLKNTHQNEG